MKKKIIYGFLMLALSVSAVSSFVSCKDYDEDMYVDLKDRISKETTLREALEIRVNDLEAIVKAIKSCQCDLSQYYTKVEADKKFVSYEEYLQQITALKTADELLENRVKDIEDELANIKKTHSDDMAWVVSEFNKINTLILEVKQTAENALKLAQDCNIEITNLKKVVNDLQTIVTGLSKDLEDLTKTVIYVKNLAEENRTLILSMQEVIDSIKKVHCLCDGDTVIINDSTFVTCNTWTIGDDGYWYLNGVKTDYRAIGLNGVDGKNADVWTIGPDGYWYKNGVKTQYRAIGLDGQPGSAVQGPAGPAGKDGKDAIVWTIGDDGYWYKDGVKTEFKAIGQDGVNGGDEWTIGDDGYWYKNGVKTDKLAVGQNGTNGKDADWTIGDDGYWYNNGVKTDKKAVGTDGTNGTNGTNGKDANWTIGSDGYWYNDGVKTDKRAVGTDGTNGKDANWTIGADGYWYNDGVKTDKLAVGSNGKDANWTIGADGYWYNDGVKTDKLAVGSNGQDADQWTIGADGYWYKNGVKTDKVAVGTNGTDADVWTIGADGFWYLNGVKTANKAVGTDGTNGRDADIWTIGSDGYWYKNGEKTDNKANGAVVWSIGADGYWYKDGVKTDTKAVGVDGKDAIIWTIGADGYWYKDGVKTDSKAVGTDGTNGRDGDTWSIGADGYWYKNGEKTNNRASTADVWSIGTDGYWYKNGEKTETKATGDKGETGAAGRDADVWTIVGGYWYKNGENSGVKAEGVDGAAGPAGAKGDKGDKGDDADVWTIGTDGYWYKNGEQQGYKAVAQDYDPAVLDQYAKKTDLKDWVTQEQLATELAKIKQCQCNLDALKTTITNEYITYITDQKFETIADMEDKVKEIQEDYNKQIEDVNKDLEDAQKDIESTAKDLSDLTGIVSVIKEIQTKDIYNITIQATSSPVLGYLNTPFDVRSNMLFAYFGKATGYGFYFPTNLDANYVEKSEVFTDEEMELMGISDFSEVDGFVDQDGGVFINEKTGNAGKIYFSVNPNEVSLKDKTFSIVNSLGQECPITLSAPYKSNTVLTFGYTRAGNATTMYETNATLAKEDAEKVCFTLNQDELVGYAKNALKSVKSKSATTIAEAGALFLRAAWNSIDDQLPAYGLQSAWTDSEGNSHTAVSQLGLMASAVQPLSFGTLQPLKGQTMYRGMDRIQDFIADAVDQIKIQIKVPTIDVSNIHFDNVSIDHFADGKLGIKVWVDPIVIEGAEGTISINGGNVYNSTGAKIGTYDPTTGKVLLDTVTVPVVFHVEGVSSSGSSFEIDYTDDINDLIDQINDGVSDVSKSIADLLNQVNEFNKMQDYIDAGIEQMKDNMIKGLNRYVTKAYTKLNTLIVGRAYRLFDVCLVGAQNGKVALISQSKRLPTKVSGTVTLFPTSYTLELFAPAYKKFIAVTAVYNADRTKPANMKSLIQSANGGTNMMKVIDGNETVKFSGQSGKIYEVSYAAVDYRGQMTRKKFYIQF